MSEDIEFTIQGNKYVVPSRFDEGHVLTAGEASALNQLYVENVRNNMGSKIKAASEAGEFDLADFRDKVFEYASTYNFGVRAIAQPKDPVMTRARKLVIDALKTKMKAQGYDLKGSKDRIEEAATKILADETKGARFIAQARELLAMEQSAASDDLDF